MKKLMKPRIIYKMNVLKNHLQIEEEKGMKKDAEFIGTGIAIIGMMVYFFYLGSIIAQNYF